MFDRPAQPDGTTTPAFGQFGDLTLLSPDPPATPEPPAPTN